MSPGAGGAGGRYVLKIAQTVASHHDKTEAANRAGKGSEAKERLGWCAARYRAEALGAQG